MDPEDPARKQIYLKLSGRLQLNENLDLWGRFSQDIYNDFSDSRESNSLIRKVRSDINKYLTQGESGVDQLFLEYRASPGSSVHLRTYLGYLVDDVRGSWLGAYSRYDSRFAFGTTVNALRQRASKRNLD